MRVLLSVFSSLCVLYTANALPCVEQRISLGVSSPYAVDATRFLLVGGDDSADKGVGNLLSFFPAQFYFALLSSRAIVVSDQSLIGQFCAVLQCGFPLLSEVLRVAPRLAVQYSLPAMRATASAAMPATATTTQRDRHSVRGAAPRRRIPTLRAFDFPLSLSSAERVFTAAGYDARSDWWGASNDTARCVHAFTGCAEGDVRCVERVALNRLFPGPFRDGNRLASYAQKIVRNADRHWVESLFTRTHGEMPRFDVAVHVRNQFDLFEGERDARDPAFQQEVQRWLESEESRIVFEALSQKVSEILAAEQLRPFVVYIAADNEQVKEKLVAVLQSSLSAVNASVVFLHADALYHTKNIDQLRRSSEGRGVFNVALDWYALSLARRILAWRRGGTRSISTFVHSARIMLGNGDCHFGEENSTVQKRAELMNVNSCENATSALRLVRTKRGSMVFENF